MTTTHVPAPLDTAAPAPPRSPLRSTLRAAVRAELIGLRTVRSTGCLAVAVAVAILAIGIGGTLAGLTSSATATDVVGAALGGVGSAVVMVAALGVLAVTGDYASGVLATVVTAVPRRSVVLVAKLVALVAIVFPVSVGSALLAVTAVKVALLRTGLSISLLTPGVARAILGVGLYLSAIAVLAAALGWLLRSTAGALVTWLGLWTVPTFAVLLLPPATAAVVGPLTPGEAGGTIATVGGGGELAAWTDFGVLAAYATVATLLALLFLRRRDI